MAKEFKLTNTENKKLKLFHMHGVHIHGNAGNNQVLADCPFCLKEEHFYINKQKLLWDCKVCGEKGNQFSFLEKINKRNIKGLTDLALRRLGKDRGLPISALRKWEIGYFRGQYSLAVRSFDSKIQDIRLYKIGHKVISTAGAKTGLFGLENLIKSKANTIYICEGEWDTIAMQHLLERAGMDACAVCSPGAGVFKAEWTEYFRHKKVYVCYDNDQAGDNGAKTVKSRLSGTAESISFLIWPEKYDIGYDIRDFYRDVYLRTKKPRTTLKKLLGFMRSRPKVTEGEEEDTDLENFEPPKVDSSITPDDVYAVYDSKLYKPDHDVIDICCMKMISNQFGTDPLWTFIVAPPSSGKTEILNGFKYFEPPYDNMAKFMNDISVHSLISGMKLNSDPSVLAELDGQKKTLFIKDFTSILTKSEQDKSDLFSVLRESYDGKTSKQFGNGVNRIYRNLNYSMAACVTYQIYDEASSLAALGERFCKIILRSGESIEEQEKTMMKAMDGIGKRTPLEKGIAEVVYSAVKNAIKWCEDNNVNDEMLSSMLPDWARKEIMYAAWYTAMMRAGVSRDKFNKAFIKSKPTPEKPTRFALLLATMAIMRALWHRRLEVNFDDIRFIRKIALDTINPRDEEILRLVYKLNYTDEQFEPTKRAIQMQSTYTPFTVEHVLQDMVMVGILETKTIRRKRHYTMSKRFKQILDMANIYKTKEELNRSSVPSGELKYVEISKEKAKRPKKLVFKKKS